MLSCGTCKYEGKTLSLAAGVVSHAEWKVVVCWSAISPFIIGLLLMTGQL